jgi:NAD(P)-dependent dehydrogenase (short-subunit alcohol dehydrogenase family)
MNLFDLTGKTAVIVGGTSTLGGSMAVGLGGHGAKIAIAGRNQEKGDAVVKRITDAGGSAKFFSAEATQKDSLEKLLADVLAWTGRVDILMNCPGKNSTTPFFDLQMTEVDEILNVNLKSVILACQVFAKRMIEQGEGGSIINISSASSEKPLSKVFTYSASKAAVDNMTKFMAREFAPHKIRVNSIVPGFFPAEQNRKVLQPERVAKIMAQTPMNRFGESDELMGAAIYLASDKAASFVTGSTVTVDGGFGCMRI